MTDNAMHRSSVPFSWAKAFRDLRPRLISGATMLAVGLTLLFAGTYPFALLILLLALVMCWEWGRVVRGQGKDLAFLVHASGVAAAVFAATIGQPHLGLVALLFGAALAFPLSRGVRGWLSAFGVFYVGLPALILIWLRSGGEHGAIAVLFLLILVWAADIGAFIGGRIVGGYKLWPSISPNKTWSGLVSGVAASCVTGVIFALAVSGAPWLYALAIALVLSLISQGGDLAESALKRGFNVKDASDLIPGHGGVMDRMDGVVTAALAAGVLVAIIDISQPAKALLYGH